MNLNIFDPLIDGVVVIDNENTIKYCNESFSSLAEKPSHRITNKKLADFITLDKSVYRIIEELYKTPGPTPYIETKVQNLSLKTFRLQVSANRIETDLGFWIIIILHDVTLEETLQVKYKAELKQKEDFINKLDRKVFELEFILEILSITIQNSESEFVQDTIFQKIIEKLPIDFVFLLQTDSETQLVDDLKLTSFYNAQTDDTSVIRHSYNDLKSILQNQDLNELYLQNKTHLFHVQNKTLIFCMTQGKNLTWSIFCFAFSDKNQLVGQGNLKLLQAVTQQTSMFLENQSLYFKSITDEKTKIYNNRYFQHRFELELKRSARYHKSFALLVIDIDHFKKFNDTHGHLIGDLVLIKVAEMIKNTSRNTDIVARFGGEEFVVLCVETDLAGSKIAAERIRKNIEDMRVTTDEGHLLSVTISLGVSHFPENGKTLTEIMTIADNALYEAKRNGRNRVEIAPYENPTKS